MTHATQKSRGLLLKGTVAGLALAAAMGGHAVAQDASEEVIVTGIRGALREAIEVKRNSSTMIDQINAEDIADFPDSNLAEAIQRVPGVTIMRDNGEGRQITIRGLGGDFTTTRVNGMDALSTAGGFAGNGDQVSRTRSFDFNTFASELFSSLRVTKSAAASTDEGSLGATVDLATSRPFDFDGRRMALSLEAANYSNGGRTSPRIAALVSDTFFDNKFGVSASIAYSERDSTLDMYHRNIGTNESVYRNMQHAGVTHNLPTNPDGLTGWWGYARPAGFVGANANSSCPAAPPFPIGCGSDPAAVAAVYDPDGDGVYDFNIIAPGLPTLSHQQLEYDRLGATLTAQWRPTDRTLVTVDYMYSSYNRDTILSQITPLGLNRNNYNITAANNPAGLTQAQLRSLYPRCTPSATQDCGGTTIIPGTDNSRNLNNLDPIDFYNWVGSPGYTADPLGIAGWVPVVGRPNTLLMDGHVFSVNGQNYLDYYQLDNVDWRSIADGSYNETEFNQLSLNIEHEFTDRFRVRALIGQSEDVFNGTGYQLEINAMDQDGFIYDERGGGDMPQFTLGFDAADSANWNTIKGLSTIRIYQREIENTFNTSRFDFTFDLSPNYAINFGLTRREYANNYVQYVRGGNADAFNPTVQETPGMTVESMGNVVNFGKGLDLPAGTTTSWFAPTHEAFISNWQIDCNCANQFGDWRLFSSGGNRTDVEEISTSYYAELDFDTELAGRKFFGNVGLRYAQTEIDSSGNLGGAYRTAEHSYDDYLPALNLAYEIMPDVLLRFAASKALARPTLVDLSPGGSVSTTCTAGPDGCLTDPSISIGNPYLNPYRSSNYDASIEWYFSQDGLLSFAIFRKEIESSPQRVLSSGPLSAAIQGALYDEVVASITDPALLSHIAAGNTWSITQQRDSPGGYIEGLEISFQMVFSFLPQPLDDFGFQMNYTHLDSELEYVLDVGTGVTGLGPYLNASPDSVNATLYYEASNWQARVSTVYRAEFADRFPLAPNSCSLTLGPVACPQPQLPWFRSVEDSVSFDASFAYDFNDNLTFTLEGLNLTEEPTNRWAYDDVKFAQQSLSHGRIVTAGLRLRF
jgi:TonB-dependent receptor